MLPEDLDGVALSGLRFTLAAAGQVLPEEPDDLALCWAASLVWLDDEDREVELATAELWMIQHSRPTSVHFVLDAVSSDFERYTSFFEGEDLHRDLGLGGFGDHVVIVDRVDVPVDLRGRGFGPLLVAEALSVVGRGSSLIGCEPVPYELAPDQVEWVLEKDRLERLVGEFGFVEWRDGLWFIDPALVTLDQTRERLRARFC